LTPSDSFVGSRPSPWQVWTSTMATSCGRAQCLAVLRLVIPLGFGTPTGREPRWDTHDPQDRLVEVFDVRDPTHQQYPTRLDPSVPMRTAHVVSTYCVTTSTPSAVP
jgi:hypothetical protein